MSEETAKIDEKTNENALWKQKRVNTCVTPTSGGHFLKRKLYSRKISYRFRRTYSPRYSLSQRGRKPSNQNNNKVITLIANFRGVRTWNRARTPRKEEEGKGEESEEEVIS